MDIASLGLKIDTKDLKRGIKVMQEVGKAAEKTEKKADKMSDGFGRAGNSLVSLRGVVGTVVTGYVTQQLIDYADTWTLVTGRLKLVTESTAELISAQEELFAIAQDSRVELAGTVDLYTRFARSTRDLQLSQSDLLNITETVNKSIIVSGASALSAEAALIQLGQGLAAGALRGQELNSVMEQTPRLARAIADGLGVSIAQLRAMGAEGELTADAVTKALLDQSQAINSEFADMPGTFAQAMTRMKNSILKVTGELNTKFGITDRFAKVINDLADAISGNEEDDPRKRRMQELTTQIEAYEVAIARAGSSEALLKSLQQDRLELARLTREQAEKDFRRKDRALTSEIESRKAAEEAKKLKNEELKRSQALELSIKSILSEEQMINDMLKNRKPLLMRENELRTWEVGASNALKTYTESAMDAAENANNFFTSTFNNMENALVSFVQTGKLEFKDFANSIIADLIRIAIRQQVVGPLAAGISGAFSGAGNVETKYYPTQTLYDAYPTFGSSATGASSAMSRSMRSASSKMSVNIIDQRTASSPQIETESQTGPDGTEMLKVFVREEVRNGINSGSFDQTFSANLGTTRRPVRR